MLNALYLSFGGYSEHNGISKKRLAQIKGLTECGWNVVNCYYTLDENGHSVWMADSSVLADLGKGIVAKVKKRVDYNMLADYVEREKISFVYMRSDHNASPFLVSFVKRLKVVGACVAMEIPTYPYDQEYIDIKDKCKLIIDKLFRKQLAKQVDAIVTFSNASEIFGQRTICISNGIDFSHIRLKRNNNHSTTSEIHMIGVAEIHYWHGFDRLIAGLGLYYQLPSSLDHPVYFHIVGEFSGKRESDDILPLIERSNLSKYVIIHGGLFGEKLDEVFDIADIGIGSLARHRSGITHIKTLKNREYAARGIPFIYSETDDDFDDMPYVMKLPADESPIDIQAVVDFYESVNIDSSDIRGSIRNLSWKDQMQKVLDSI